jgi:hypothetical protein
MATQEKFTVEMCEALFAAPKYVASKIRWKPDGQNVKFRAQVLTQDGGLGLELIGYWGFNPRYGRVTWGFSLTYRKHLIRAYDMAKKHKNPGEPGKIRGPHKHRFHSRIARYAYKPSPPICDIEPNQSLMDFLVEANIKQPSDYQAYMFMVSENP